MDRRQMSDLSGNACRAEPLIQFDDDCHMPGHPSINCLKAAPFGKTRFWPLFHQQFTVEDQRDAATRSAASVLHSGQEFLGRKSGTCYDVALSPLPFTRHQCCLTRHGTSSRPRLSRMARSPTRILAGPLAGGCWTRTT